MVRSGWCTSGGGLPPPLLNILEAAQYTVAGIFKYCPEILRHQFLPFLYHKKIPFNYILYPNSKYPIVFITYQTQKWLLPGRRPHSIWTNFGTFRPLWQYIHADWASLLQSISSRDVTFLLLILHARWLQWEHTVGPNCKTTLKIGSKNSWNWLIIVVPATIWQILDRKCE